MTAAWRWEYRVLNLPLELDDQTAALNEAGRAAWELVTVCESQAYLKRQSYRPEPLPPPLKPDAMSDETKDTR
jgi:sulfur transfer protein SufE